MMLSTTTSLFRIVEHVVPCQHIREYPAATAEEQEDVLHLAVKQYIPVDNLNPQPGDVTILAAHGNGFHKELYEPFWEEIYKRLQTPGVRIRGIWMADVANQGQSGIMNENLLGNDPTASYFDHSRDLLHLVNMKRSEMPQPIVGIGHSMGGAHIANLSLMHPRLLHSLVLIDPVMQRQKTKVDSHYFQLKDIFIEMIRLSTYRRDRWPSRKVAADSFKRNAMYQTWDPRVLEKWVHYGLRDLPTAIHPLSKEEMDQSPGKGPPVTLATTLHQEAFCFVRPTYDGKSRPYPDIDPTGLSDVPFYRPEPSQIFEQLPHLRPSVLYIFGGKSPMGISALRADKVRTTGTGVGGSGGVDSGRVRQVLLERLGHLIPQEDPNECAESAAEWLGPEIRRWHDGHETFRSAWRHKSKIEKVIIDRQWKEQLPVPGTRSKESKSDPSSKL